MIRFWSDFQFKNKLVTWWNERKVVLQEEYDKKESELLKDIARKETSIQERIEALNLRNKDLEEMERRVQDRKEELARVNEELKSQIRLIEAKASPHQVWESAVTLGFSKAWDMMIPLMREGLDKVKDQIREQEIEASLPRVESVVEQRIREIGEFKLKESYTIEQKKREFIDKKTNSSEEEDKKKYTNYIDVLDWILGSRNGH